MTPQQIHPKEKSIKMRPARRKIVKHFIVAVSSAAILGLTFWLLWNQVGAVFFRFPPLTYGQALGAVLTTGFLVRIGMFAAGRHRGGLVKCHAYSHQPFSRCRGDN